MLAILFMVGNFLVLSGAEGAVSPGERQARGLQATALGERVVRPSALGELLDRTTVVRVLLERPQNEVRIDWPMKEAVLRSRTGKTWRLPFGRVEFTSNKKGWVARIRLSGGAYARVESPAFTLAAVSGMPSSFQVNQNQYRGSMELTSQGGKSFLINHVSLKDYLAGTLPSEMQPTWDLEVLKAQAIASRSYALNSTFFPKHPKYDLENTVRDQVYLGVKAEHPATNRAVQETAGWYLKEGTQPARAFYHAKCGGKTESPVAVWGKIPSAHHLVRVDCPYCQKNPTPWKTTWDKKALAAALHVPFDSSLRLSPAEWSPSGKIAALKLTSSDGSHQVKSDALRATLGYSHFPSAPTKIKDAGDRIVFEGLGQGHGVGLCQWGARHLAKSGKTSTEILRHYYPKHLLTQMAPVPRLPVPSSLSD